MSSETDFYQTLLESTKAIPWRVDWATRDFTYIGPQVTKTLGWPLDSWSSLQDWVNRIHVDDRKSTYNYCVQLAEAAEVAEDHEVDYRAICKDGSSIWVRAVIHIECDNGEVAAISGFMFDISARKRLEFDLLELNKRYEALLLEDPLTKVFNRTALEQRLEMEIGRAKRSRSPLSVLFIDIDEFRAYNDCYGHRVGDNCLRRVAESLQSCFRRPADLVARFGEDEFVVVLPDTDLRGALNVAETCRSDVFNDFIPHERSSISDRVTLSIGLLVVDETVPYVAVNDVLKRAGHALFNAKTAGRNQLAY